MSSYHAKTLPSRHGTYCSGGLFRGAARLSKCPEHPYPLYEIEAASVGKTPYVRFDWNDYSVPHTLIRSTVTVQATLDSVTILEGTIVHAQHIRSYDKAQQIESAVHIEALVQQKKAAHEQRNQHRLTYAVECGDAFLKAAALQNYALGPLTKALVRLLDDYGAHCVSDAMADALARGVPHVNAVQICLQKSLDEKKTEASYYTTLSAHSKANELIIKPHSLSTYEVFNQPGLKED